MEMNQDTLEKMLGMNLKGMYLSLIHISEPTRRS